MLALNRRLKQIDSKGKLMSSFVEKLTYHQDIPGDKGGNVRLHRG